jgi:hypothetical protein
VQPPVAGRPGVKLYNCGEVIGSHSVGHSISRHPVLQLLHRCYLVGSGLGCAPAVVRDKDPLLKWCTV